MLEMDFNKVGGYFRRLDNHFDLSLCEIKDYVNDVLNWSNNVKQILEKEAAGAKLARKNKKIYMCESELPKPPHEVRTRRQTPNNCQTNFTHTELEGPVRETRHMTRTAQKKTLSSTSKQLSNKSIDKVKPNDQRTSDSETLSGDENALENSRKFIEAGDDTNDKTLKRVKLERNGSSEETLDVFKKPIGRGKRKRKNGTAVTESDQNLEDTSLISSPKAHSSPKPLSIVNSPQNKKNEFHSSPKTSSVIYNSSVKVATPSVKEKVAAFERLRKESSVKNACKTAEVEEYKETESLAISKEVESAKQDKSSKRTIGNTLKIEKSLIDCSVKLTRSDEKKSSKASVHYKGDADAEVQSTNVKETARKSERLSKSKNSTDCSSGEKIKVISKSPIFLFNKENQIEGRAESKASCGKLKANCKVVLAKSDGKPKKLSRVFDDLKVNADAEADTAAELDPLMQTETRATRKARTKTVQKGESSEIASKRTKPILKSKIFDKDGNNLLAAETEKTEDLETTYVLPSTSTRTKPVLARTSRVYSDSEIELKTTDKDSEKAILSIKVEDMKPVLRRSSRIGSDMELPNTQNVNQPTVRQTIEITVSTEEDAYDVVEPPKPTKRTKPARKNNCEKVAVDIPAKRTKPLRRDVAALLDNERENEKATEDGRSEETLVSDAKLVTEAAFPEIKVTESTQLSERNSNQENQVKLPKKKRTNVRKNEEMNTKIDVEIPVGGRVTRTKTKAAKQAAEEKEGRKSGLSLLAKKSLNKAKIISLKKIHMEKLLQPTTNVTPQKILGPVQTNFLNGKLLSSSKYQVLLNSTNKMKTPLSTFPSSLTKGHTQSKLMLHSANKNNTENSLSSGKGKYLYHLLQSTDKDNSTRKRCRVDSSTDSVVKTASKQSKDDQFLEKELQLKSKQERQEEAVMKRQQAMKSRQEELKRKNEVKLKQAMKQREKLEMEKYNNIVQSEKEKDEKHRVLQQEREMKLKEEAMKRKILTERKIAETEERRRVEEEARMKKLREQEAEQLRLQLEKQKEIERQEKRERERLAEKKAKEQYELKLKQEQLKLEKAQAAKKALQLQSANKKAKRGFPCEKKDWNYKARNENDYGLEDENSEVDSGDEEPNRKNKPIPAWAQEVMKNSAKIMDYITLDMLSEYMPCYQKTPDIQRMFKMTPSKRIKRSSSAIWNTPRS